MLTLSSLLVQRGIASMRTVEEAIARQVLHGGDLATSVLDLGSVSEAVLTPLFAESLGLEPAVGRLRPASPEALRALPSDLAVRHSVFPLELRGVAPGGRADTLVIATSEPLTAAVEEDLSFALGLGLKQVAAPLVRIRQAHADHYGIALERRLARIAARLDGRPDPSPSALARPPPEPPAAAASLPPTLPPGAPDLPAAPPAPAMPPEPAPPVRPGVRALTGWLERVVGEQREEDTPAGAPVAAPSAGLPAAAGRLVPMPVPSSFPPPRLRRKGPFTPAMAEEELAQADTTDGVLEVVFDFAHQYFDYAALFVLHGDVAHGRRASGPGATTAQVTAIRIPLDAPSALATTRERSAPVVAPLAFGGVDGELVRALGRPRLGLAVAVIPVSVRGRVVALLYGDDGEEAVELSAIGDVISLVGLAAPALERVILLRKRGRQGQVPTVPPGAVVRLSEAPEDAGRGAATAAGGAARDAKGAEAASGAVPADKGPLSSRTRAALLELTGRRLPAEQDGDETSGAGAEAEAAAHGGAQQDQDDMIDALARALGLRGTGVEGPPESINTIAAGALREGHSRADPPPPAKAGDLATAPTVEMPMLQSRDPAAAPAAAPRWPPESRGAPREVAAPAAPAEAEAPPPAPTLPGPGAPRDYATLVQAVLDGGVDASRAFAEVVRNGEAAMKAISARFPGPLWIDRRIREQLAAARVHDDAAASRLPSASQCGPLLELIIAIRRPALPFMTVRAASPDPDVRFWATHVLGELRYPEAANALLPRLFDDDAAVRKVARRAAAALVYEGPPGAPLLQGLEYILRGADEALPRRLLAIETAAEIRAAELVPALIATLDDPHEFLAAAAAHALTAISRKDLGRDAHVWRVWWASEGRVQLRVTER